MLVIALQLHHQELWPYFRDKLEKLNTPFDLYVTTCVGHPNMAKTIKATFPNANIKQYPNKGQDIGPFIQTLKRIRNNDYKYLIKLHSKKCHYNIALGNSWRNALVNALISSDEQLLSNMRLLETSNAKMCGTKEWCRNAARDPRPEREIGNYTFIAGTMFMVDFKTFTEVLPDEKIDRWYAQMPNGYKRGQTFTHRVERLLGKVITQKGYDVVGV